MQWIVCIDAEPWSRTHRIRKIKTQIRLLRESAKTAYADTRFLHRLKKVPDRHVPRPEPREVKEAFHFIAKACGWLTRVNQSSTEHERFSLPSQPFCEEVDGLIRNCGIRSTRNCRIGC